jgi:hypothetical protein
MNKCPSYQADIVCFIIGYSSQLVKYFVKDLAGMVVHGDLFSKSKKVNIPIILLLELLF